MFFLSFRQWKKGFILNHLSIIKRQGKFEIKSLSRLRWNPSWFTQKTALKNGCIRLHVVYYKTQNWKVSVLGSSRFIKPTALTKATLWHSS